MFEKYDVDCRRARDLPPTLDGYEEIEIICLDHAQKKVPDRPHTPIRFVGVVPRRSIFAKKGFVWIPNCVNEAYINNIITAEIDGVLCQAWAVVEPDESIHSKISCR